MSRVSILLLHRHVASFSFVSLTFPFSLRHIHLLSSPCLSTCSTAPSPLRGLFGLSQPNGKRHIAHIGKQAAIRFIGAFVVKPEHKKLHSASHWGAFTPTRTLSHTRARTHSTFLHAARY